MYVGKYLLFDDNKRPASMCKEKESHSVFQWGNTASLRAILCTCLCHSMLELIAVTIKVCNHAAMCGIKVCTSVHTVLSNSTEKI